MQSASDFFRLMRLYRSNRLKHSESELKKKKADLKSTEKGYEKDVDVAEKLKKEQEKIEVSLFSREFRYQNTCAMVFLNCRFVF